MKDSHILEISPSADIWNKVGDNDRIIYEIQSTKGSMKALKDLQKDLEFRKYKLNPFEKKYVDLTISSCVAGCSSNDDSSGLDHLSKSIRARSDIISCQVEFLVKEAMRVIDISCRDIPNASGKASNKMESKQDRLYFIEEDKILEHSLLDCLETNSNAELPEEVISAKLPWLEEVVKSFEVSKLKEIISPFLAVQSPCALPLILETKELPSVAINGSCTEILLLQNREEVDERLNLSVGTESTCSITRFLRFIRPFSFDSNEKFEVEADRAYVKTKSKDEVHDEQKEDNLEAEIRKDFNINQSEERVHALSHQSYDENNGHNHDSFTFDDLKKEKPIKYHQSMEESHFIEGSDSDSGRSDSTDCMFETFNEKKDLSNTAASSRKLLSILSAKISKISERKPIAKYEDNVFVEKSDIQKNDGKTDISSLSYTLRGIPKLLDLHSARLKQDNALANLNSNNKGSFKSVIADDPDDLLLPMPTNSIENYKKKCDIKEGVDRGTTHFLQNCIAENYSLCQDAGTATSDDFDKDIRERVNKVDCIRYFSGTSIAIYSSGIPSKALCIPDVIKGHGQSINCKTKSLWSPVGPGFGLDKDLRQLLKELRPLEFADLQYQLIRTREGSKLDADDEWANTASLFGSNFGEGNKIDGLGPVGWGQGYGYGYGQSSDEFFGGDICDNLTFDLPDEVIRPVDFRNYEDDNFLTFNIDTDTDHRKSEKFLNAKDRRCPDNLSKKRKKSNDGAYQIDEEREITSDDSDDGVQSNTDAIISKSNDLEVTKICAAPVSAMRNCRFTSYKKSLQASASSGLTSVTNIICRPLLPVSIVQQLLRRFISPPPSRSLIKLDSIMPHDLVTESYPNIDHEEGKAQYAKRVFVGLLFLADSYNRQNSAATLTSIRDPIQIHLSNAPQSSQRSCSVLVNFR